MDDVLVLCYHGLSETWPASTSVRPEDFERQIEHFVSKGYRGATLSEALSSQLGEKTLVVTFDDAHRSVLELAAPAMARLGVPGTIYVPTGYPDSDRLMGWDGYDMWLGTEHEDELRCMSWEELRGLGAEGWEIGAHTRTHPRLSQLKDEEVVAEITNSRNDCEERMGSPCTSIAYPYSDYDERAIRAASDAGYRFAVTVPRGPRAPLPLEWPRVGVYQGESARRVRMRAWARRLAPALSVRTVQALRGRR